MGTPLTPPTTRAAFIYAAQYHYSEDVVHNDNQIRVFPRDGEGQRAGECILTTDPETRQRHYQDRFGNPVVRCRITEAHQELIVTARGDVELETERIPPPAVAIDDVRDLPEALEYTIPTALVEPERVFATAMSISEEQPDQPTDLIATVQAANDFVYNNITYLRGNTTIATTAHEVLDRGEGVCQDKAHLLLGLLRAIGIPVRYVSGLLTGERGETHAWVEFIHPSAGWLPVDPTRGIALAPPSHYIKLAIGLDYVDVSPINGSFLSKGATQQFSAAVEAKLGDHVYTDQDARDLLADAFVISSGEPRPAEPPQIEQESA